jgi:sarcosine oxidase, subunit alpha
MTQPFRTPAGGRIRRDRLLNFTFNGRKYTGFEGDTLASALLANDVHRVGRSFKYHRPRGILSAGSEEPNALVTIDREPGRITPNLRATQMELYEGLKAHSQNHWPSLRFDLGATAGMVSPLLGAGFYYKTFKWPASFWKRLYEPAIRRTAGLGHAPADPDADRYMHQYAHCDVLVIGAGPAGLAAALAATANGARVILCDEQTELGGSLLSDPTATIDGWAAPDWLAETLSILAERVTLLPRTTAFGWYPDNLIGLVERVTDHLAEPGPDLPRERLWQVRAIGVIIATGAIERPLVFPHNDRPGIMLAGAARTYLHRYGVKVGGRCVVAATHDDAWLEAAALHEAGLEIAGIVDPRPDVGPMAQEAARAAGIPAHPGTAITATEGRSRVHTVKLSGGPRVIPCDTVLMSGGWTPSVHLFSQSRGRLRFDGESGTFLPGEPLARERSAGACAGIFGLAACLDAGWLAGGGADRRFAVRAHGVHRDGAAGYAGPAGEPPSATNAATEAEDAALDTESGTSAPADPEAQAAGDPRAFSPDMVGEDPPSASSRTPAPPMTHDALADPRATRAAWPGSLPSPRPHAKAFVDFQNDVTTKDLRIAIAEGFHSIEHVKRYTTTGMATDQGKTSNLNALGIVAGLRGSTIPAIGLTTFRPPYTPVTFGSLAGSARGALFDPVRHAPLHDWAVARGALFEDAGTWKRALCFPRPGETMHQAVARECHSVRDNVGVFDASTLGKIEVAGPDAVEFLNRMYTGDFTRLPPGRCRYAVLLGEDGFIRDDGIVARLAPDRFHVTTTTGGAASVLHHMEDYLQTEFPDLRAWLTSVTEQWAVIAVQGPRALQVVAPLTEDTDPASMRHMSVRACRIAGVPARLFRVSFTGEVGFEINVPSGFASFVWNAVMRAGETFGIVPYGTEAMHVLRAEKGYIIVGQETDGTVIPSDAGLDWTIGRTKRDFVGMRSLARPDMVRADRKQLVGLLTKDPTVVLQDGAQVVTGTGVRGRALGHVTSAYRSETLRRSIALALVAGGRARLGETMFVPLGGRAVPVSVVDPVFYDREGSRLGTSPVAIPAPPLPPLGPPAATPAFTPAGVETEAARVTALAPTTRLAIRAGTSAATGIGRALGVLLGTVPCRAVVTRDRAALWLGPDEWLVLAPDAETGLAEKVAAAVTESPGIGTPASIVDVSHRATSIEVAGPRAAWCLNAFCALDLDPHAFPVGMCTRTLLGKAEIVLWRIGAETFHIEVARSLTPYVHACLDEARREFRNAGTEAAG